MGGPIVIPNGAAAKVRVDADGRIWADDREVDQLRLVSATSPDGVTPLGAGTYTYSGELQPWQGSVVQGALERANVDAADEMLRLMETTRHIDSVRRAISTYDQMLDRGINNLGNN
jgi:flagellar basal-body rod protein FlgF